MTTRIDLCLAYVAGQLTDHWHLPTEGHDLPGKPEAISLNEWQDLVDEWWPWAKQKCSLPERLIKRGVDASKLAAEAHTHFSSCRKHGVIPLDFSDYRYPANLKGLRRPPIILNCWGDLDRLSSPMVAIVGARKATARARKMAFDLGKAFAKASVSVVSGGAYGCDISAHQGVLKAGGTAHAIIVMAGGLATLYPQPLVPIFKQLKENGALIVSERLFHHKPMPYHFPIRNRIIAGLSEETVLLQAARKSGAMLTALESLNAGRRVFVLRGDPDDIRFEGNLLLEFEGAPAFETAIEYLYLSKNIGD